MSGLSIRRAGLCGAAFEPPHRLRLVPPVARQLQHDRRRHTCVCARIKSETKVGGTAGAAQRVGPAGFAQPPGTGCWTRAAVGSAHCVAHIGVLCTSAHALCCLSAPVNKTRTPTSRACSPASTPGDVPLAVDLNTDSFQSTDCRQHSIRNVMRPTRPLCCSVATWGPWRSGY